jgi:hypothetical protein
MREIRRSARIDSAASASRDVKLERGGYGCGGPNFKGFGSSLVANPFAPFWIVLEVID